MDSFTNGSYWGTYRMKIDPGARKKLIVQEKDRVTAGVKNYSEEGKLMIAAMMEYPIPVDPSGCKRLEN
ncbi:hypothetical protein PAL_GLEAN10001421 [Pteropus alecto]|uniref:Uncharacterized protein n=1 Tax=Pteropus alecto TaxID=9402 RepID=L5KDT8_PTEAL|nr:hypothetical protein PAL_GLEAN10001421 [Pteropus alecto]